MSLGSAQNSVAAATQSLSSSGTNAGVSNGGAVRAKDRTEAETAPQFGEVMQNIQAKYGARPEKGREIKKTLGKDDFLRIMITQMKNQDPTKPFDAEQMATQMAQFTSVEQLKNMNESLNKMTAPNQPLERLAMTNMIGKTVTVDRSRFPHTEGQNDQISFGLPRDAEECVVSVINDQGETVLQKELGKTKAGEATFAWDGKKSNTLPAKSGTYMIRVDAKDAQGVAIESNPQSTSRVVGVSYEGAEAVFLVGDAKRQEKVTMKNIVRIDEASGASPFAQSAPVQQQPQQAAAAAGQGAPAAQGAGSKFFTFQKGLGSANLDAAAADPATQRAIAGYQASGATPPSEARGFPNGLQSEPETRTIEKGGKPQ